MKRYVLFAYYQYEASGGWNDFQGSFGTGKAAMDALDKMVTDTFSFDYAHIIDMQHKPADAYAFLWNRDDGWCVFDDHDNRWIPIKEKQANTGRQ